METLRNIFLTKVLLISFVDIFRLEKSTISQILEYAF